MIQFLRILEIPVEILLSFYYILIVQLLRIIFYFSIIIY